MGAEFDNRPRIDKETYNSKTTMNERISGGRLVSAPTQGRAESEFRSKSWIITGCSVIQS